VLSRKSSTAVEWPNHHKQDTCKKQANAVRTMRAFPLRAD
jgi:hypothetical protein